jgi:hypothetical protein
MLRESHLFAYHKFLEERGSQILTQLAKCDFRNGEEISIIRTQLEGYITTLKNHAFWEEEFIFKKFFTQEEVSALFEKHADLENQAKQITIELKSFPDINLDSRISKGKEIYLNFRILYSVNLSHFYEEETTFLSLLQARATDEEIRAIDKSIYQSMNSVDIVEMLKHLLPPTNSSEKKSILDDLKHFNPHNFDAALQQIKGLL